MRCSHAHVCLPLPAGTVRRGSGIAGDGPEAARRCRLLQRRAVQDQFRPGTARQED